MRQLLERLEWEVAHPDTSGAPYVNDADLLAECLAEIKRLRAALQGVMECTGTSTRQYHIASDALMDCGYDVVDVPLTRNGGHTHNPKDAMFHSDCPACQQNPRNYIAP